MEILKNLKFLDYPECVHKSINLLSSSKNDKNYSILGINDLSDDIISQIVLDCIFTHTKSSQQYHKFKIPTCLWELQTIEIILYKFSSLKDSNASNQLFQSIFKDCEYNNDILSSLNKCVSFAIGLKNTSFLNAAAYWMQNKSCSSSIVINVCEYVLDDYYKMSTDISSLKDLSNVSPIFTCCLIICLTNIHASNDKKITISTETVLNLIADWLLTNSCLGLSSLDPGINEYLHTKQRQTLWTSPSKPNNQTPIPGLVLWLVKQTANLHLTADSSEIYATLSKLHLSILQTILSFPTLPGSQQLDLFTLSDMQRILTDINNIIKQVDAPKKRLLQGVSMDEKQVTICPPHIVELIGERLSQILQVGLTTGAFRCAITDLHLICKQIPECLLLEIIKTQHLSVSTPLMHNAT